MADLSWIGGAASATAGIIGSALNYVSQQHTNEQNATINQQNLDYNKEMTLASWERDDNAHQREVADLEAAGLSPLASMQGSGVTSPLGAPSPIAMQAPQIDTNSLINGILGSAKLSEEHRHNRQNEQFKETELDIQAEKNKLMADEIDLGNKELNEKIRYQTNLNKLAADNLAELIRSNKKNEEIKLSKTQAENLESETRRMVEEAKRATGGKDIPTKYCYTFEEYKNSLDARIKAEQTMLKEIGKTPTRLAKGSGVSDSAGLNLGFGKNGGTGANVQSGENNYYSQDNSKNIQFIIDTFNNNYPMPVFIDKKLYPNTFKD